MATVQTTPTLSAMHAANFRAELRRAGTVAELKKAADRHSDYLLGQHKEALRKEYVERLGIVKGHAK